MMNFNWVRLLPEFIRVRIEGRHYLQNVISNTGWLFFDNILRMGVGLFVGVWMARYLGPDQYGQLSYALAFVALFAPLANVGAESIAVRNIVRDPSHKDQILGSIFMLKLIAASATVGILLVTIFLLRPADRSSQWLVGITAAGMIFQAFDTIDYWFESQVQSKFSVITKNTVFLFSSAGKVVLIFMKAPLVAFAWIGAAEIAFGSIGLVLAYKISGRHIRQWHPTVAAAKDFLRDSWPLILSGIAGMIYLRIDQVMLGEMKGNAEVGIYSVAVRISEVWYFIPRIINSSVLPSIVEAKAISEDVFYDRLQKLYNIMAFTGFLVAIPVTFLSPWIIQLLFGPAYARAGSMLALLVWAGLFVNLGFARSSFLMTMNWTKIHSLTIFIGCIVNVGLNLILIPRYGGMGAVIASCVAYWVAGHGSCFLYKPLFRTGSMLTKAIVYPKIW